MIEFPVLGTLLIVLPLLIGGCGLAFFLGRESERDAIARGLRRLVDGGGVRVLNILGRTAYLPSVVDDASAIGRSGRY